MRPLLVAVLALGCSSSTTLTSDGSAGHDAGATPDDAGAIDGGSDLGTPPADAGPLDAAIDGGADAFVTPDGGPPTCADYPERLYTGDFEIHDEGSLTEALELTAIDGTLTVSVEGVVELPRLRRAAALVLSPEAGRLELDAPCLGSVSILRTGRAVTLASLPLDVETASIFGDSQVPSLRRATELRGGGDLRLDGLEWVGSAELSPRSLSVPALREAGWLRILTPGRRPTRGDAPVNLPSLVSVEHLIVDTAGAVRATALRTAEEVSVVAAHGEFPSLEHSGLALVFRRLPGSAGLLDLPSLQAVERLVVTAHEPSTVRAPVLSEVMNLELVGTTPEMVALEEAHDVWIRGAEGFELPALRRVVEFSLLDVTSASALEFAFGGIAPDQIPTVDVGSTRAPAFRLLGTSLVQLLVYRSEISEIAIPNAPTINGVTVEKSEVDQLLFSAPPSAYWIHILDVVGITQCECEALAPYVIDDGYVPPGGDFSCEGLIACE